MIKFLKVLGISSASVALALGLGTAARADLVLSPIYVDLESKQGKASGVLNVSNTGSEPIRVRLSPTPFTYNENGEFQRVPTTANDLTPYLQYSPGEVTILPGKTRRVRLLTLLPPNLADGEYRAAMFAETLSNFNTAAGYRINLITRIGSAIYVSKGNIAPNLQAQSATFNPTSQQLRLKVSNTGQATARVQIQWSLKLKDTEIAAATVGSSILPGLSPSILLNRSPNSAKLAPGEYSLAVKLIWGQSPNQTTPFKFKVVIPSI